MIGFGRPAMATVRDETRMPGDHCTRGSGYAPDRLVKADFPAKLYFEFHHFCLHLAVSEFAVASSLWLE
ncbi:MAG: hypothetical protein ABSG80_07300 [Verrucomicrobiota bacterium]